MNISISRTLLVIVVLGVCLAGVELVAYSVKVLALGVLSKLRKRKRDRRIIRQAKAAGAWYNVNALGGRALELRAWEPYRIKRKPGEKDICLRQRIERAQLDELAKRDYSTARLPGETNEELRARLKRMIDERGERLPKYE